MPPASEQARGGDSKVIFLETENITLLILQSKALSIIIADTFISFVSMHV
jgi:hypothetical protein